MLIGGLYFMYRMVAVMRDVVSKITSKVNWSSNIQPVVIKCPFFLSLPHSQSSPPKNIPLHPLLQRPPPDIINELPAPAPAPLPMQVLHQEQLASIPPIKQEEESCPPRPDPTMFVHREIVVQLCCEQQPPPPPPPPKPRLIPSPSPPTPLPMSPQLDQPRLNHENKRSFDTSTLSESSTDKSVKDHQPKKLLATSRPKKKTPDRGLVASNVIRGERKRTKPQRFGEPDQQEFRIPKEKAKKLTQPPQPPQNS